MSVVVVLIGFSILVAAGFLVAFLWAVRSGQYEDRYTPSVRILLDEPPAPPAAPGDRGQDQRPESKGSSARSEESPRRTLRNHHTQGS